MSIRAGFQFYIPFTFVAEDATPTDFYMVSPYDGVLKGLQAVANGTVSGDGGFEVTLGEDTVPALKDETQDDVEPGEVTPFFPADITQPRIIRKGQPIKLTFTLGIGAVNGYLLFDPLDLEPALPHRDIDKPTPKV